MLRNLFHKGKPDLPANTPVYLVTGLGNPGREYRENRHNVGFMAVDHFSRELGIPIDRMQSRALVGMGRVGDNRIILAKPQTFMNLSGQAVIQLVHFYKIPLENLLVIHDDLDLPLGSIRLRPDGGPGGQKGVASIIQALGTQRFSRLRIGIGRPPGRMDPAAYVLQDFSKADLEILTMILDTAAKAVMTFLLEGTQAAMNRFNGSVSG